VKPMSQNWPQWTQVSALLGDLVQTLSERGRAVLSRSREVGDEPHLSLVRMAEALLSRRGEASGVALAELLLDELTRATRDEKLEFLLALARDFGPDLEHVDAALEAYRAEPGLVTLNALHEASEPRRQELFRRLNLARGGTKALVTLREEISRHSKAEPDLACVNDDFGHLFGSWFNRGFLQMRRIDWTTPANVLEKIIQYEAVHAISDWDDLRNRLEPPDRRCYAFFHPQLADVPLIFVEVALTKGIPDNVDELLTLDREPLRADEADTAVFYSISNTQKGLAGVSFGNFLIKQVVEDLKKERGNLKTFVTLSPVPGFASWLAKERTSESSSILSEEDKATLTLLDEPGWETHEDKVSTLHQVLLHAAAGYFLVARRPDGRPLDPVGRFHLGNGARLERLNMLGDRSPKGLKQSHGLMVNYLYALDHIEKNHEAYAERGEVIASGAVQEHLLASDRPQAAALRLSRA